MQIGTSSEEILHTIKTVMQEMFELDPARVHAGARLVEDLALDSIDAIDLAVKVEEVTGLAFDEKRLRQLRTVGDVIAAIQTVIEDAARAKRIPA